jgi:hypothetical protein
MNCDTVLRRLLASERPDRPGAEVQHHLARCPACRAVQRKFAQVERQLPLLPVPPSAARARLLRTLREAPAEVSPEAPPRRTNGTPPPDPVRSPVRLFPPAEGRVREGGRQKLAVAVALAATLAAFAVGLWSWPRHQAPAPNPMEPLALLRERVLMAPTPRERLRGTNALAYQVLMQAHKATADDAHLHKLAEFYEQLVLRDLLREARALPRAERKAVLVSLCRHLDKDHESTTSRRAAELERTRPAAAASLRAMASAARQSSRRIRALF